MLTETTLRAFYDKINDRDLESIEPLLSEDVEFLFPKTRPIEGRDRFIKFFNILFKRYPELKFKIHRILIDGKQAAVHWTNQGHNRKGERYENEGITLMESDGQRIRWISDFFKDTGKF